MGRKRKLTKTSMKRRMKLIAEIYYVSDDDEEEAHALFPDLEVVRLGNFIKLYAKDKISYKVYKSIEARLSSHFSSYTMF